MKLSKYLRKIAFDLGEELHLDPLWTKRGNNVVIIDNNETRNAGIAGLVIENGVHRAVSAQTRGEKSIRGKLNWPGKKQMEIEIDVRPGSSPLLSPKSEIDFDPKHERDISLIEVSPLKSRSTLGLYPLESVGKIRGKNKPRYILN